MHSTFGRWSALLIAALAGVALSGCGGDDNNNDNSGPPPTAPKVQILSSQPQMVSGTTALIDAELDVGATFSVTLNGADVSGAFKQPLQRQVVGVAGADHADPRARRHDAVQHPPQRVARRCPALPPLRRPTCIARAVGRAGAHRAQTIKRVRPLESWRLR